MNRFYIEEMYFRLSLPNGNYPATSRRTGSITNYELKD